MAVTRAPRRLAELGEWQARRLMCRSPLIACVPLLRNLWALLLNPRAVCPHFMAARYGGLDTNRTKLNQPLRDVLKPELAAVPK